MISHAMEDYLKIIYKEQTRRRPNAKVTTSLVAERMGVAAASATNMIKKLAEMKLLSHTPYRGVELTEAGTRVALETIRHHRLLELYLSQALGFAWDQVDAEADRLEHAISEDFEDRIDQALGFPTVGAHGEPIPSKMGAMDSSDYHTLADLEIGHRAVIRRVSDRDAAMLRYIETMGLRLGTGVEIRDREPFNGHLTVCIDRNGEQAVGLEVAQQIFVSAITVGTSRDCHSPTI